MLNAVLCATIEEFEAAGPGAIYIMQRDKTIAMKCPGCGKSSAMEVYPAGQPKPASPSWELSGLPDKITLKPSINCVGCCGWHAYLTNGVYG